MHMFELYPDTRSIPTWGDDAWGSTPKPQVKSIAVEEPKEEPPPPPIQDPEEVQAQGLLESFNATLDQIDQYAPKPPQPPVPPPPPTPPPAHDIVADFLKSVSVPKKKPQKKKKKKGSSKKISR